MGLSEGGLSKKKFRCEKMENDLTRRTIYLQKKFTNSHQKNEPKSKSISNHTTADFTATNLFSQKLF